MAELGTISSSMAASNWKKDARAALEQQDWAIWVVSLHVQASCIQGISLLHILRPTTDTVMQTHSHFLPCSAPSCKPCTAAGA